MALKACRECGAQVSTEAETCPHCGVRAPTLASSETSNQATFHHLVSFDKGRATAVIGLGAILHIIFFGLLGTVLITIGLVFLFLAHWLFWGICLLLGGVGALTG